MLKRRQVLAGVAGVFAGHASSAVDQNLPGRIAAASDLQFALPELAGRFERASGARLDLSFGSSGNFARQIEQGAPMELFLSADEGFVMRLADAGRTRDRGALYALGRIALIVPGASNLGLDERLDGLRHGMAQVRRFSIANPEHAPYGRAAREALMKLGLWAELHPLLVLGENVSQATQFVSTGSAQAGITAASLALAPPVAARTRGLLLPHSLHAPLRPRMVLMKTAGAGASAFYDYLRSADARAVLARHGFSSPDGG
jgi:molybdate transport system substrate-binding protein